MNDFERSLKEHADKFQMVPSKKVWHGIYNDLHPGKRWPSVTMSLLLIFTLVVIGHLNTNNTNNTRHSAYLTNKVSETKGSAAGIKVTGNSTSSQRVVVRTTDLNKGKEMFVYSPGKLNNTGFATSIPMQNYQNITGKERLLADNLKGSNIASPFFEKSFLHNPHPGLGLDEDNNMAGNAYNENIYDNESYLQHNAAADVTIPEITREKIVSSPSDQLTKRKLSANKNVEGISYDKKAPNAETAAVKLRKKRNPKVTWTYFAGPSLNSVSFGGESLKQTPSANFSPGLTLTPKDNKVLHNSVLGLEAGTQMSYTLTKKLQFTAGMQFTYSGYSIVSNQVHPTVATLVLKDPATGLTYLKGYLTHYGDGTGQAVVNIRNYSWQASIPIGLQYEFLGNKNVQFNIAGNIEPSLILKSNAYILSSDGNNYVNDPSLLRKWNINSNFGAFVTFRSIKFKWQIGPNLRYQWLSTYRKEYTVKEHLINYGIRIGVSR